MKCPSCAKDISATAAKCPHCGADLLSEPAAPKPAKPDAAPQQPGSPAPQTETIKCPRCGKEHIRGAYKCLKCGNLLSSGEAIPKDPAQDRDLCPHCGKEVVKGASKCRSCGKTILHGQTISKPATEAPKPGAPFQAPQKTASSQPAPAAGVQRATVKPGSPLKKPDPAQPPGPGEISPTVLVISIFSCIAAIVAAFLFNLTRMYSYAALPVGIAIALGITALILNQKQGPLRMKILAGAGIGLALLSLVLPALAFFGSVSLFAIYGLTELYGFLAKRMERGSASGIIYLVGFGFFISFIFLVFVFGDLMLPVPEAEAKRNLIIYQELQKQFFQKNKRYASEFGELGWKPVDQKKFAYYMNPIIVIQPPGKSHAVPDGIVPDVSETGYLFVAVGNLDDDDYLEVWSIRPGSKKPVRLQGD